MSVVADSIREAGSREPRGSSDAPGAASSLAADGARRLAHARAAIAAHSDGDLAEAERHALSYLGFAPPTRASGDVARPLAADARYRRVAPVAIAARVRALTGGVRTAPPPCCQPITAQAAADPSGFSSLMLPRTGAHDSEAAPHEDAASDGWLLSPLDPTLGFVPCSYRCAAAVAARRSSLAGRDLVALRALLAVRLLRLAPGIELLIQGPATRRGGVRIEGLYALLGPLPPSLLQLVEALLVRRLLAGREVRVITEAADPSERAIEVRQGLVFVKMLHPDGARWVDLA